jgi:hypothetical protein
MASRRGDGGGGQSLYHHPNAPFQLRRDYILALQTLQRGLQVPSLHHGEVRVVAGLMHNRYVDLCLGSKRVTILVSAKQPRNIYAIISIIKP